VSPRDPLPDFRALREAMVREHVAARGVRSPAVLAAMRRVPREDYVPAAQRALAYADRAQSIAEGQTISQPYIVGHMLDVAEVRSGDRVLEIGTGSGYCAAVLAEIAAEVHSVERIPALAVAARERLLEAGYDQVWVHVGDGTLGLADEAPFDAIVVTAGGPDVPDSLLLQLAPHGRLVMPIGDIDDQYLVRVRRPGRERFDHERLGGVRFVPLIGREGWRRDPR
jgi:protein-L-isoaspartate(D-aspartate) O-methyltransferase